MWQSVTSLGVGEADGVLEAVTVGLTDGVDPGGKVEVAVGIGFVPVQAPR